MIVEPYVPPVEIERALERTGLLRYAAALHRDAPLPTLGELVADGTRLVLFAEKDGGARPWYMPAFSFTQDTPLGAVTPAQLSCKRFRGDADSPILLLNHWIDRFPPRPSDNEPILRAPFLRERIDAAAACGRSPRGSSPSTSTSAARCSTSCGRSTSRDKRRGGASAPGQESTRAARSGSCLVRGEPPVFPRSWEGVGLILRSASDRRR